MKKLLTILLITLISNQLFAQEKANRPLLRKIDQPLSSILSPEHQSHLKSLKESNNYLDVSVVAINPLAKTQNGTSFMIDLPNRSNTTISNTKILEQRSEYETILQGEIDEGNVLLIQESGRNDWQRTTGWWFWQQTNRYGSIMRTQQQGRTRVAHFSNPFRTHQGQATGVNGTSHNTRVINVNGRIVCDFRINPPAVNIYGSGLANGGDRLTFTSSVSQGRTPYTYRWQADRGGGFYTASTSSSLSITMPQNDDLNLRLTVTDADSRVNTDTHFTRNSFLNGGGCTICPDSSLFDTVSEEEVLEQELPDEMLVYPNPTVNELQIVLGEDYESYNKWQIVDLQGKLIMEATIDEVETESRQITINIKGLSASTYILNLLGTGEARSIRFIKD